MAWGGYRQPSKPAPVSGPGANSRRTDGQPIRDLPNPDYGEQQEFRGLQQSAPLASAGISTNGGPAVDPLAGVTGLDAPSADPNMPVTAGAALGAGPGPEALGLPAPMNMRDRGREDAQRLRQFLPVFINAASRDDASPEFRKWVRNLVQWLQG